MSKKLSILSAVLVVLDAWLTASQILWAVVFVISFLTYLHHTVVGRSESDVLERDHGLWRSND